MFVSMFISICMFSSRIEIDKAINIAMFFCISKLSVGQLNRSRHILTFYLGCLINNAHWKRSALLVTYSNH